MKPGIVDGNEKESAVQQTEEPKTAVSMEDVTFYYQKSKEPALEHISFTAKKGETIGIIGGTGSGKSTLVSLNPKILRCDRRSGVGQWKRCPGIQSRESEKAKSAWFRRKQFCSMEQFEII